MLLKNEDRLLPLAKQGKIAVIGTLATKPRYQGGGSSHILPTKLDNVFEEIVQAAGDAEVFFAEGYPLEHDEIDAESMAKAIETAQNTDVAVLFIGLPDRYESEGYDREHLSIPQNQIALIEAVASVQPNLVAVLSNGAPIEMPWLPKVKAVLEGYLGGQALGGAIASLLFGDANPSGKLAETFPMKLSDNPSYLNFPGDGDKVEYKEGIFVGYRYYDAKEIEPLFPFGHGLSYTEFSYRDMSISAKEIADSDTVEISVFVKNTGKTAGKEIVQLYVRDIQSSVRRPGEGAERF